jgi:hypothetical protein
LENPYDANVDAWFFAQVRNAVEGIVIGAGPDLRTFAHPNGVKVWFGDSLREHYEAQLIRAQPSGEVVVEIGFHAEHPIAELNEKLLQGLLLQADRWRPTLGEAAQAGPFIGRRGWTRISECWDLPPETLDSAIDVAARLGEYVVQLEPLRRAAGRANSGTDGLQQRATVERIN